MVARRFMIRISLNWPLGFRSNDRRTVIILFIFCTSKLHPVFICFGSDSYNAKINPSRFEHIDGRVLSRLIIVCCLVCISVRAFDCWSVGIDVLELEPTCSTNANFRSYCVFTRLKHQTSLTQSSRS